MATSKEGCLFSALKHINTKNWKVKVSGKREWDSKTQQLAEVENDTRRLL